MSLKSRNNAICIAAIILSFIFILAGCSSKSAVSRSDLLATENAKLIYEETLCPNKAYVISDKDLVFYNIRIYQDDNFTIIVNPSSNFSFFEDQQYTLSFDKSIAEDNINVHWTSLMGNPEASEDDQFAIAQVSVSDNGEVISERRINFAKNAIEIIVDAINRNK